LKELLEVCECPSVDRGSHLVDERPPHWRSVFVADKHFDGFARL
jgi:hypothetical protein